MNIPETTPSPGLSEALAHDAAGRHGDAFNVLKGAAGKGDLQAMSELGHRLLAGDRAPKMVDHALSLLTEAARGGEGRALARVAALTAAGAYMPQDWPAALQLLARAAAAGDAAARGQLLSLQPATPEQVGDWPALAARIPIQEWLSPAAAAALHPKVHRVSKLAPPAVCSWLIERARGRLEPARVYDSITRSEMVHEMRTNTAANFDYATLDVVQFLVQARMARTCSQRLQQLEAPMVLHYDVGQQITPHFDFIDSRATDYEQQLREQGQRIITFLLYLNDGYAGGETTFPLLGLWNRGTCGDGLYFINSHLNRAPDRDMLHTGSPPTAGEKWIVSQFVRDIALRP